MAKRLFGTDGIRGVAGEPPLDPRTVTALGIALGDDLQRHALADGPVLVGPVLVGRELTRANQVLPSRRNLPTD